MCVGGARKALALFRLPPPEPAPCVERTALRLVGLGQATKPLAVAAALGHASAETTWKHYAHCFDEARLASATDPETSVREARECVLRENGLRPSCDGAESEARREAE